MLVKSYISVQKSEPASFASAAVVALVRIQSIARMWSALKNKMRYIVKDSHVVEYFFISLR